MIRIEVQTNDEVEEDLEASADRARNLDAIRREIADMLERHNRDVRFDTEHEFSIFTLRSDGSGSIGAKDGREGYAELLDIPDAEIAEAYHRYIVDGD